MYDTRLEETLPLLQFVYYRVKGTPPTTSTSDSFLSALSVL